MEGGEGTEQKRGLRSSLTLTWSQVEGAVGRPLEHKHLELSLLEERRLALCTDSASPH